MNFNVATKIDSAWADEAAEEAQDVLLRRASRVSELQGQVATLLSKMKIAVIYGGNKDEEGAVIHRSHNPRSWKSYEVVARDIANSLSRLGAQHVSILADDMRLPARLQEKEIDFAWLNTGGVQGFASVSHAASFLEMLGIPYVGHDPLNGAIMDSKHCFKRQMIGAGIPTARFITWHKCDGEFDIDTHPRFQHVFQDYDGPFIAKPVSGRASLNVEYVENRSELKSVMDEIFAITQNYVMVEQYLSGREFCIAAAGPVVSRQGELERMSETFSFAPIERNFSEGERIFTSMDKKPITGERIKLLDFKNDAVVIEGLHKLAKAVVNELDIETLIRLDVRADNEGNLLVLETNPKPDLKAPTKDGVLSIISAGLAQYDMSYDDLILSLIADRIDVLMSRRRGSIHHLLRLLEVN